MAKILLYDLEITPILAWVYEMWDTNVVRVERDQYIMSFSWNWLDSNNIGNLQLPDFPKEYSKDRHSDKALCLALRDMLDEADVVVAHNAEKFDNRVALGRILANGLDPPSPFRTIDTLKVARANFRYGSNTLAALCDRLTGQHKPSATHAALWYDCVQGDMDAWRKLKKYNNKDVAMLRELYLAERPFMKNHPNIATIDGDGAACPRCGSHKINYRGYAHTTVSTFRKIQCKECGSWSRERLADKNAVRPLAVNIS